MNSVSNFTVLNTYLQPLDEILGQEGVAEISINEPEKGWVEKFGKMYSVSLPVFTYKHLYGLAKLIAQSAPLRFQSENHQQQATPLKITKKWEHSKNRLFLSKKTEIITFFKHYLKKTALKISFAVVFGSKKTS